MWYAMRMRYQVLGALTVTGEDGAPVPLPAGRARTVLALLCANAGRPVSRDRLIDVAWEGTPPATAITRLHSMISELRRALPEAIRTSGSSYVFTADPDELDLTRARRIWSQARVRRDDGDLTAAVAGFREGLALWRGRPFEGIACAELDAEAGRIEQEYAEGLEEYADLELRLGHHASIVGPLRDWVQRYPLRESLTAALLRALARSGRPAEAIAAYDSLRRRLADELGVDPAAELRELYQSLLAGDRALPAETEHVAPAQLPADVADFTGRRQQIRQLHTALTDGQDARTAVAVAVVRGPGGFGKTALAVHVAHLATQDFPDGQLFVNLAGTAGNGVPTVDLLGTLLRDLGVPAADLPAGVAERAGRYRSLLAGRKVLLLLDDARDTAQVQPLLPGAPTCGVLVTSRAMLTDLPGARRLDLAEMPADEAGELFGRIIGANRAAREPVATRHVLDSCGGLPLAIRIAASKLAARPGWSVAATADRLAAERTRLAELHTGDLAVRASFQLSYDGLAEPAARAFRLLGLPAFPAIDLGAAAALFGLAPADAERALEVLADGHMLHTPEPGSYRMHDLLRLFAAELAEARVEAVERDEALGRLLDWYAAALWSAATVLAEGRQMPPGTDPTPVPAGAVLPEFGTHGAASAWCLREYPNLIWAVRTAAELERHDLAVRLASLLWMYASRTAESSGYEVSQRIGLTSAQVLGDELAQAWLLGGLGSALSRRGADDEAAECYEASQVIRARLGDTRGVAAARNNIGNIRYRQGRFDEAIAHYQEALRLAGAPGAENLTGYILLNAGRTHRELGADADSHDAYTRALAAGQAMNNLHVTAEAMTGLGETLRRLGRLPEAIEQHQRALAIHREIGTGDRELPAALDRLASAYESFGRTAEARDCLREALRIAEAINDPQAAEFREHLASVAVGLGSRI